MTYVDGFVFRVYKDRIDEYKAMAKKAMRTNGRRRRNKGKGIQPLPNRPEDFTRMGFEK